MSEFGFTRADVIGFSHNHNADTYCNSDTASERREDDRVNRYPSDQDWGGADWLVAGGANPVELTLYVMSCTGGAIYPFGAIGSNYYRNLDDAAKSAGEGLPNEVGGEACQPQEE